MIDLAFRNITRQKTRTFLTVLGIVIGIGAIVALGSIAAGIDDMVQNSLELVAGKIIVIEGDGDSGGLGALMLSFGSELTSEDIDSIQMVSGVSEIIPMVMHFKNFEGFTSSPEQIIGIEPEKVEYFKGEKVEMYEGRELEEGDTDVGIIGKTLADKYNLEPGDYYEVVETDFEIVGVIESTGTTDIDMSFIIPLEDLQSVLEIDTYQMLYVIPDDITETEIVAEDIEDEVEGVSTITGAEVTKQASDLVASISFFTIGIGAVAAFVGGLGVMNTMIMAVIERRKEIGVMKAIGATNNQVLRQFLLESAMISMLGGGIGCALGAAGALSITIFAEGMISAIVTLPLLGFALLFALGLGLVGGLYPAWKAAKLDPVDALRYE